jgi:phosphoserine phosphatase RsbU/P
VSVDATTRAMDPPLRRVRVGLLVDELSNEYAETIVAEVIAAAAEQGVEIVCLAGGKLFPADLQRNRHAVFDFANPRTVDGVLVLPLGGHVGTGDMVAFCRRYQQLPICSIAVPWREHPCVLVDNETGLREGIRHLVRAHGHSRLAFVGGQEFNAESQLRYNVYREVLAEHGLDFDPGLIAPGDFEHDGGVRAARILLDERKATFGAVVCANDSSAIGVIEELKRHRIAVPGQVAIVGFDDLRMSRYMEPALTTVRQPVREQARLALQTVLGQLRGAQPPAQIVLKTELVIRESCGCPSYVHPAGEKSTGSDEANGLEQMLRGTSAAARAMRATRLVGAPDTPWPEHLYSQLVAEVAGASRSFLRELEGVIRAIASTDGDVGGLHKVITVLVESSRHHLRAAALWRADRLLHAARVKINGGAGRVPIRRKDRVQDLASALWQTSRDLATVTNVASLKAALAARLASCTIAGCYICLYEGDRGPSESSRLIVAYDAVRNIELPQEGVIFPSGRLLPDGIFSANRVAPYVVCPLECGEGSSGYVVFEGWTGDGFVYDGLAGQIESTLGKMLLLDRLMEEAKAREAAEAERLESEVRIATEIQASILPQTVRIEGLEIAAAMRPATEVGGDYYDVVATPHGCWIGIGDVTGHGLTAGLVMLMLQGVVRGVSRRMPDAPPSEIVAVANAVVYENVRVRMGQSDHVTLTLLRYERSGRLTCAGAHEAIIVCRAEDGRIECIETPGTWLGLIPDVRSVTTDTAFELRRGDLMLLYTDGMTEARNHSGEMFGIERLAAVLTGLRHQPVDRIRDTLLVAVEQWMATQEDDLSILVARHHGVQGGA